MEFERNLIGIGDSSIGLVLPVDLVKYLGLEKEMPIVISFEETKGNKKLIVTIVDKK